MASAETENINLAAEYLLVDDIPEIAAARQERRQHALNILERRRNRIESGGTDKEDLPLPINALSTGVKVNQAACQFGEQSHEYIELRKGLSLDCQRLVAEWWRKKKPEYFPLSRHYFDESVQEFFSHGLSIRQMTENGLSPQANNIEEEARRVNEHVEDATPQLLRSLGGLATAPNVAMRTISECTDRAVADYESDMANSRKHRGYGGYVPEIKKIMIRDIRLDTETKDRFEEQVGIPGVYITHEIIKEALERRGARVRQMDKTELHGAQFLAGDGLLSFVAYLDEIATAKHYKEIFMGEEVPAGTIKDYEAFEKEALARQAEQAEIAESVLRFILDLAADTTLDPRIAPGLVEDYVKLLLFDEVEKDISLAEQIFDEATARGVEEVLMLESLGLYEEANRRQMEVIENAPGGGFCGAGSCGLESVAKLSAAEEKGHSMGLKGDLIKDRVRTCPDCHRASIIYDKAANKACLACGLKRINGKTSKAESKSHNKPKAKLSKQKNTPEKLVSSKVSRAPVGV